MKKDAYQKYLNSLVDNSLDRFESSCPNCGAPSTAYRISGGKLVCAYCDSKLQLKPQYQKPESNPMSEENQSGQVFAGVLSGLIGLLMLILGITTGDMEIGARCVGLVTAAVFLLVSLAAFRNAAAIHRAKKDRNNNC